MTSRCVTDSVILVFSMLGFFKTPKSHIFALPIPCLHTRSRSILETNEEIMKGFVSNENVALRTCGWSIKTT